MVDALVEKIIDKKELRGIAKTFAQEYVQAWLKEHPQAHKEYLEDPERFYRKKSFGQLRSDVREHLRRVYGVFFTSQYPAKRETLVDELLTSPTQENALTLMAIHRSTKERLDAYEYLYERLFELTGKPTSILDIGCGYNPFSYPFLGCKPSYVSADIACEDLALIGRFHTQLGIENEQHCVDLTQDNAIQTLPAADVAFAFKVFDSLEEKQRGTTKRILDTIKADYLVASFPTMSIGQKKHIAPRAWFERLVTGKVAGRVTLANEQFVIITLKQKSCVTHSQQ